MARAAESKRIEGGQSPVATSAGRQESTCVRCGGLMVSDSCIDFLNSTGELECAAKRCVQCGEVVDAVIQRNRRLRLEPVTVRFIENLFPTHRVVEGPY
jgi:hypothetical protein